MSRKYQHRKDRNHAAIAKGIEARGQGFIDTSQTGLGFDGLVTVGCPTCGGKLAPVEIKDPSSSRGLTLSPKEEKVHAALKAHGIHITILTCEADLDVLGRVHQGRREG